jgi:NAD(P)-dependent dehydrogenase (short-subunit alcohol dehydrogenase family)
MASYVIVGASRGIGYAFMQHLAKNPKNTVIGTVRTLDAAKEKAKADGLTNVHFIQGDLDSRESLRKAAAETAKITGGSLDYLIVNGVYADTTLFDTFLDDLEDDKPDVLDQEFGKQVKTNVLGYIKSFNAWLPLLKKGNAKKVLALTSGLADDALTVKFGVWEGPMYSATKAALNTIVAKYAARFQKDGILFLAISPGVVDTGDNSKYNKLATYRDLTTFLVSPNSELPLKFMAYAPQFAGPLTPADSVAMCLAVLERSTTLNGASGAFVSHYGNKQWI